MSLQLDAEAKDEARLRHKREVLEKRQERIRDPRNLAMGIDTTALDAQMREKKQKDAREKEAERLERARLDEVNRLLEEAVQDEKRRRDVMKEQVKDDWLKAQQEIAIRKVKVITSIDPESCGPGACQKFVGEDFGQKERQKMQKEQMKRWVEQQMKERSNKEQKDRDDDETYSQYVHTLDDFLGANQQEQADMRRRANRDTAMSNKEMADEIARTRADERARILRMNEEEISATMSLDLMLEDVNTAVVNDHGKVARRDHFKGFTTEQRQKIFRDNERLLEQRREAERMEKEMESKMDSQTLHAGRQLEKAVTENALRKEQERRFMQQQLKAQMEEQAAKRMASRADRFGTIDDTGNSLYSKFNGR